jgi:hypothetical protein
VGGVGHLRALALRRGVEGRRDGRADVEQPRLEGGELLGGGPWGGWQDVRRAAWLVWGFEGVPEPAHQIAHPPRALALMHLPLQLPVHVIAAAKLPRHPQRRIQLVDVPQGGKRAVLLGAPLAAVQAGGAAVAGLCVELEPSGAGWGRDEAGGAVDRVEQTAEQEAGEHSSEQQSSGAAIAFAECAPRTWSPRVLRPPLIQVTLYRFLQIALVAAGPRFRPGCSKTDPRSSARCWIGDVEGVRSL